MYSSIIETITYRAFIIELHHDTDCTIEQAIGDAPIELITSARFDWHAWNNCAAVNVPTREIVKAIDSQDLDDLCDACGHECERLPDGRVSIEFRYESRKRFYKSAKTAFAGILRYEELTDIEVWQFQTNGRQTVYAIANKSALVKWSGNADCTLESFASSIESYLDGECYGYVVKRVDGDDIGEIGDSCWGFVGDSEYCIEEAKSWIDSHLRYVAKQRQLKLKTLIRNHAPLHLRSALLQQIA